MRGSGVKGQGSGFAVAVIVALGFTLIAMTACGGGDEQNADEITRTVEETIEQPGMVYHVVEDDGAEAWLDAANEQFRRKESSKLGGLTSVGEGWTEYSYDAFTNAVLTKDLKAGSERTGRIDNPVTQWDGALGALAFGDRLDFKTKTIADGVEVYVLEAFTPILNSTGEQVGSLNGRVEIDTKTNLIHAFESKQVDVNGVTPTPGVSGISPNRRIVYTKSEMIARDTLPADLFDKDVVGEQLQSPEENMERVRALGLEPLWLGVYYPGPGGILQLPQDTGVFPIASESRAEIHYSLTIPTSPTEAEESKDTVIIRLAKDASNFKPPTLPEFAGTLPESSSETTVNGTPATLYTSILTTAELPCTTDNCVTGSARLFRRLVFFVGDTAVQIEASTRVGPSGQELDGYNDDAAIVALAEALSAPEPPAATPTPVPGPVTS